MNNGILGLIRTSSSLSNDDILNIEVKGLNGHVTLSMEGLL